MTCPKRRYRSEAVACDEARRIGDASGDPLRAYPCPACGGWHLTSTEQHQHDALPLAFWRALRASRAPRARTRDELERLARAMRGGR